MKLGRILAGVHGPTAASRVFSEIGAHHGRLCRTDQVLGPDRIHEPLVAAGVCASGALGVGAARLVGWLAALGVPRFARDWTDAETVLAMCLASTNDVVCDGALQLMQLRARFGQHYPERAPRSAQLGQV